jgi:predicted nucleic acid-binding protein
MTAVLVDSSVLIDLATGDADWGGPSRDAILHAGSTRELVINPIIFAEVSIPYRRVEDIDDRLPRHIFRREDVPWEAAFLAGKAFLAYRRRGGSRRSPLPDFFIGAHAAVRGYDLLTRDAGGIRSYFPGVAIIEPERRAP